MPVETLERELYTPAEAARLLQLPAQTLRRWLLGAERKGVWYEPVIRVDRGPDDLVTWGEFVEAAYLREYRKRGVKLDELRALMSTVRSQLGVRYPLAHQQYYVGQRALVLAAHEQAGIETSLFYVVATRKRKDQLVLADGESTEPFITRVEFDHDVVARMHPDGASSPVVIDPQRNFGVPIVHGIRAEAIAEAFLAGEPIEYIQQLWNLTVEQVRAAVDWQQRIDRAA